ncbi:MAG: hypothetical protein KJ060_20885, partial [Candidatus Hydrogenedentes bacterium]|nr:hypothetical protein [Candidatus Hydrogenedentota bacterium]
MKSYSFGVWIALCMYATGPSHATPSNSAALERFERDVRPVLVEHCYSCHGPEKQKSGLRLDSAEAILQGGSRGPAVEPGNPVSLLVQVIAHTGDVQMPPREKLPQEAIDAITAWVVEGAHWPEYVDKPASAAP